MDRRKNPRLARPMPSFIQGLRGTARGLRGDGHPRHDPPDAPPPRAPKPKAPTRALTFKTGSKIAISAKHCGHKRRHRVVWPRDGLRAAPFVPIFTFFRTACTR